MLRRYIDKYVRNIDLDKLSLWGGDMVLRNLELDVDVLEHEAGLPVSFLSARVGKVVVHIPWTSLSSQPVTVTIDLVECVVATKKVSPCTHYGLSTSAKGAVHCEGRHALHCRGGGRVYLIYT